MLKRSFANGKICVFLLAVLLGLTGTLFGQENSGRIDGTVLDETGAAVPAAKLAASSPILPRDLETTSDGAGYFAFPSLPPGVYSITITKTLRDSEEASRFINRLEDAKTEKLLMEVSRGNEV